MAGKERKLPQDFHPDLLMDRLDIVATVAAFVHNNALSIIEKEKGDNAWLLGCAGFVRTCAAIKEVADQGKVDGLTVIDPSMRFVFKVGAVRIRICRGDEDGIPNENTLTGVSEEMALYRDTYLKGFFDPEYADCVWRFVILKHKGGAVDRVELQLIRGEGGKTVRSWIMPLSADITGLLPWDQAAVYVKAPAADVKDIEFGKPKEGRSEESSG